MKNHDEFSTIYFNANFSMNNIDSVDLQELFGVDIAYGDSYINVYSIDRSIVESIADEIGIKNVEEIAYS